MRKRSGAYAVEAAFVFPVVFFLILAIFLGSLMIFKYQECSYLARVGTRYGSVHGLNYWNDQMGLRPPRVTPGTAAGSYIDASTAKTYWVYTPASTANGPSSSYTTWCDDIYGNAIYPKLMMLDPSSLTCSMAWPETAYATGMPDNASGSQLRVTLTYSWVPGFTYWLPGVGVAQFPGVTMTSQSSMPITY
jgi:hypothetical protein